VKVILFYIEVNLYVMIII